MNKAILIGRLTKDPEVRYSQSAEPMAVARYTLAVSKRIKKEGEPDADFIPCVAFGKSGEFAERFFKKGMQIAVSGRIQVRSWDDTSGQKHWSTEVLVEDQEFTESKAAFESRGGSSSASQYSEQPYNAPSNSKSQNTSANKSYAPNDFSPISESVDDEDLPF